MRDAIRLGHFSLHTEKSYLLWLQSDMGAVRGYPAEWPADEEVRQFLTDEPAVRHPAARSLRRNA